MRELIVIPVAKQQSVTPFLLKPLLGRSALSRTIAFARTVKAFPDVLTDIVVTSQDPDITAAANLEAGVATIERQESELVPALQEALQKSEAQFDCKYDVVIILEPSHAFRPRTLVHEVQQMLVTSPELESIVCVEPLRGRVWGGEPPDISVISDSFHPEAGSFTSTYQEVAGLFLLTRPQIILGGERLGASIGLLGVDRSWYLVDIRSQEDFFIAEQLVDLYDRRNSGV